MTKSKNILVFWTDEDINFLKNNYLKLSNIELSNQLNKSIPSIAHKLMKEHLHRTTDDITRLTLKYRNRNVYPEKFCSFCNGKIPIKYTHHLDKIFCSRKCHNDAVRDGLYEHPFKNKHHSQESIIKMKNKHIGKHSSPLTEFQPSIHPNSNLSIVFNNDYKDFRELIIKRDNFSCLKCGIFREDAKNLFGYDLSIHHINYDRSLSTKENCCALCHRCHCETNKNKKQWITFFQSILSEKYKYNYLEILQ